MIRDMHDGLGPCTVFSNGVEVDDRLIYADTETGEVKFYKSPATKDAEGNIEVFSKVLEKLTIENAFESKEAYAAHRAVEKARIELSREALPENPTTEDYMALLRH